MFIYEKVMNVLLLLLVFTFLLNYFILFDSYFIYVGFLSFVVILLCLPITSGLPRIFSLLMLLIGMTVMIWTAKPFSIWTPMFTKNMSLVILIIFVPVLAIPLSIGQYNQEMMKFLIRFTEKKSLLFLWISSTIFVLGSIVNLGSISVVHSIIEKAHIPKEFLGRVYVRGFTSVITWSPFFASVFLILFTLNLSVANFIFYSFILGTIQLIAANLLFRYREKDKISFQHRPRVLHNINRKKVKELAVVFFLLVVIVLSIERFVNTNMSIVITMIVVLITFGWCFFLRKVKEILLQFHQFSMNVLPKRANEVVLFLTAGFFSETLSMTPLGQHVQKLFMFLANKTIILVILFMLIITMLFALAGIHQIVTISAFLSSVNPLEFGFSHLMFALTLTCSWSLSTLISPTTPVNIITAQLLKVNIPDLIRWNAPFAILMIFLYTAVIYLFYILS
ncbi:hypothetical protein K6959_08050 [Bacillus aquiflavi]|uniref:hypothetical protein n=1 Tax=Bacillus aquiflavi TaxID=2672567 RepID=UPI001CA81E2E|nr:hypothetical protein [Bacillus aquiflavi]UAC49733.1 hypothetical protein K6959_08050 [Bacillus aquiflavi]